MSASAQELDSVLIPFTVNVDANVTVSPPEGLPGFSQARIRALAGRENIISIVLNKQVSVSHRPRARQMNAPAAVSYQRGRVHLRLQPQQYRNAEISLYTIQGRRVLHERTTASATTHNISSRHNIAAGVYLLSVRGINGQSFATKLTHRGGRLNINIIFGDENIAPPTMRQSAQTATSLSGEAWTITVQATGHADTSYSFYPMRGMNAAQNINLRQDFELNMRGNTILTQDGNNVVHVIDTNVVKQTLSSISETRIIFNGLNSAQYDISAGDIIISAPTQNAPQGFFFKVNAINRSGTTTTIDTELASLTEVFSRLSFHESADIESAETHFLDDDGNRLRRTSNDDNGVKGTFGVGVGFEGSLTVEPLMFFDFSIIDGKLQYVVFSVTNEINAQLNFTINGRVELEAKKALFEKTFPVLTTTVGIVPITYNYKFEFGAKAAIKGEYDFDADIINTTVRVENGIQWNLATGWSPIIEGGITNNIREDESESLSMNGELSVGLYAEPAVELYWGLGEIGVTLDLYSNVGITSDITPPTVNPNAKMECKAGLELSLYVKFLEKLKKIFGVGAEFELGASIKRTLFEVTAWEKDIFPRITVDVRNVTDSSADISASVLGNNAFKLTDTSLVIKNSPQAEGVSGGLSQSLTGLEEDSDYYVTPRFTNWWGTFEMSPTSFRTKGKTVRHGNLEWMTRNLDVAVDSSWCHGESPANCATYGRLYTWTAAVSACASLGDGWRLPSVEDWRELIDIAGGLDYAAQYLKSTTGWPINEIISNDEYGFSALPGGYGQTEGGRLNPRPNSYHDLGVMGHWWTSTPHSDDTAYAHGIGNRGMDFNEGMLPATPHKSYFFSARCVRD